MALRVIPGSVETGRASRASLDDALDEVIAKQIAQVARDPLVDECQRTDNWLKRLQITEESRRVWTNVFTAAFNKLRQPSDRSSTIPGCLAILGLSSARQIDKFWGGHTSIEQVRLSHPDHEAIGLLQLPFGAFCVEFDEVLLHRFAIGDLNKGVFARVNPIKLGSAAVLRAMSFSGEHYTARQSLRLQPRPDTA